MHLRSPCTAARAGYPAEPPPSSTRRAAASPSAESRTAPPPQRQWPRPLLFLAGDRTLAPPHIGGRALAPPHSCGRAIIDPKLGGEENPEAEVVELQTQTALVFIVTSSLVLLFLFFFKSSWSAWLLVFLFCVGAIQVRTQFQ